MQQGIQSNVQSLPTGPITLEARPKASLDQLVEENMPVVRAIACRIDRSLPNQVEISDLVAAGVLGLIEALQRFDPDRGILLKSFASLRIEGAMLDYLRTLDWSSRGLRRQERTLKNAITKCTATLGRSPTEEEIASELGVPLRDLQRLKGDIHSSHIGDPANNRETPKKETLERVVDPEEPGGLVLCLRAELRSALATHLDSLPERERLIVSLYYYEEFSVKDIARILDVSSSRVTQMRGRALSRLRLLMDDQAVGRMQL